LPKCDVYEPEHRLFTAIFPVYGRVRCAISRVLGEGKAETGVLGVRP
jgi:hypothetical protein